MNNTKEKEIDGPGLWLVKFKGTEATEVIRVMYGRIGKDNHDQLMTCSDASSPSGRVIPFWVTKKNLEKVYRKIKDPLGIK
jgi:hypothetical protein